jgi:hypothetical protein
MLFFMTYFIGYSKTLTKPKEEDSSHDCRYFFQEKISIGSSPHENSVATRKVRLYK